MVKHVLWSLCVVAMAATAGAEGIPLLLESHALREGSAYTMVVEDAEGNRVRNLASAALVTKEEAAAGAVSVDWDGRDEFGMSVKPGTYRYRGIVHQGIRPEILMQFCHGDENRGPYAWGPDHSSFAAVAENEEFVFFAAPVAENGNGLVALSHEGAFQKRFATVHPYGADVQEVAANEKQFFVVFQGRNFSDAPANNGQSRIGFVVYDIERAQRMGPSTYVYEATSDSAERILSGCAWAGEHLYIAIREAGVVQEVDVEKRAVVRTIAAPGVTAVASDGARVFVACGPQVLELRETEFESIFEVKFGITRMSVRGDEFALLGHADGTVKIVARNGRERRTVGEKGGAYVGPWRPKRLVNVSSVLLSRDGTMWTTENRSNPRRVVHWSAKGDILYEKYGSPSYGAPTVGIDGEDGSRVVAEDVQWKLDFEKKTATPVSLLTMDEGMSSWMRPLQSQFVRYGGKTFLLGGGAIATISELRKDGSTKLHAVFSNVHIFGHRAKGRCPGFNEMIEKRYLTDDSYPKKWQDNRVAFFWSDLNGNETLDAEEFVLFPQGDNAHSYWGWTGMGLAFSIPYRPKDGEESIVTIAPDGFLRNGVLKYDVASAIANRKPIFTNLPVSLLPKTKGFVMSGQMAGDLRGNVILNASPWMMSFAPSGKLNWYFPNRWVDVHGSHNAPLPQRGVLQALLFAMGTVPFDDEGDVVAYMGNEGRVALMTTDGLYIEQIFEDARVHDALDFDTMQEECFGGTFQYDRKRGQYLMQGGKNTYRIYRIHGLDQMKRFQGDVTLTAAQITAANESAVKPAGEIQRERYACIPVRGEAKPETLLARWESASTWVKVTGAYDATNLVLTYEYNDASPWKNHGKEWQMLFKTGDSLDLQLALPVENEPTKRTKEQPGDVRLLVAPYEEGNIAVLYRYKVAEGEEGTVPHGFSSPWRTYTVADVKRLDEVRVEPKIAGQQVRVTVTVPLASLGVNVQAMEGLHWGDFGVLFGDSTGETTMYRSYWANPVTGIVSDVPAEIIPQPKEWGRIEWARRVGPCAPRIVGTVGNSGTREVPVQMGEIRSVGLRGQSQAGPVYIPESGLLYETAGTEVLNAYHLDGTMAAQYRIPAGAFRPRNDPLVRVGDALYFRRNEELWMLPLSAEPGSEAVRAPCTLKRIKLISSSEHHGELAILLNDNTLHLWNAATGESRQIGSDMPNYTNILDWNANDELMAMREVTIHKVVDGHCIQRDGFPKDVIQRGVSVHAGGIVNGALWGTGGFGTVLRFDAITGDPAPGVVFGGRGEHTLNYIYADNELGSGSGIAYLGDDLYAVGGSDGIILIMKWDVGNQCLKRVRRIGATRDVRVMGLAKDGSIEADGYVYRWDDPYDAPTYSSWNINNGGIVTSTLVGEGMHSLRLGTIGHNSHPVAEIANYLETGRHRPTQSNLAWGSFSNSVGVATARNHRAYVMNQDGAYRVFSYSFDPYRMGFSLVTNAVLQLEGKTITDFVGLDETTVAMLVEGQIRLCKMENDTLVETESLPATFDVSSHLAADAGQLAISEKDKNRVTILSRKGEVWGAVEIPTPTALAIHGARLVAYSQDEQRIYKVALEAMNAE